MSKKKIKCANCSKVLMEGYIAQGEIEKDCPGCGERNVINADGVHLKAKDTKPFQQRLKIERK
jgi:phage FluMu protein Com